MPKIDAKTDNKHNCSFKIERDIWDVELQCTEFTQTAWLLRRHFTSCTDTTPIPFIIIISTISLSVRTSVHLLLVGISSRQRLEVVSSILLYVWQCNLPPVFWQSLMSADNAATESVKASNGEHILMYAKTSILCEERAGCYCNTSDWCQTVRTGLDNSWSAGDARLNTKIVNL